MEENHQGIVSDKLGCESVVGALSDQIRELRKAMMDTPTEWALHIASQIRVPLSVVALKQAMGFGTA
jgi:hypothetical protein